MKGKVREFLGCPIFILNRIYLAIKYFGLFGNIKDKILQIGLVNCTLFKTNKSFYTDFHSVWIFHTHEVHYQLGTWCQTAITVNYWYIGCPL